MADGKRTPLEPGLVGRVAAGLRYAVTGKAPDWFGPLSPMAPVAPAGSADGRQFDYPPGYNLVARPRAYEQVTFPELRSLADNYDLLRLVIETRKDQLVKLRWTIQPREATKKDDPRIAQATDFFAMPDREHGWDSWLRMLLEDLLVIDAPTVYVRRNRAGRPYALEPVDGATIKRVLDEHGRTPAPPYPAYQQVLKGLPAVNYTTDDLLYLPRNVRASHVYGLSPVEQICMTINIALRRQVHQLQYYTEGNVPEALIGVPDSWNTDQLKQFQDYWDSYMEGNTAGRRHARFVPGSVARGYVPTKADALKDEYDDWLARIVCYAFSVSHQALVKEVNRATAQTARQQALDEGLYPLQAWVKGAVDRMLSQVFGWPDLQFSWVPVEDQNPKEQSDIEVGYLTRGVKSINEVRKALNLEPVEHGDALLIFTASGAVRLEDVAASVPQAPPAAEPAAEKLLKSAGDAPGDAPSDEEAYQAHWERFLAAEAVLVAGALAQALSLKKAAEDVEQIEQVIGSAIDHQAWEQAAQAAAPLVQKQFGAGMTAGARQFGVGDDLTALVNERAVAYASARAGELVSDITETTQSLLRSTVTQAVQEGWSYRQLAKSLQESYAFSPKRAQTIAGFEMASAASTGNLNGWKEAETRTGVVIKKKWLESNIEGHCLSCSGNAAQEAIPLDAAFSSGHQCHPAHPHCSCTTAPVVQRRTPSAAAKAQGVQSDAAGRFLPGIQPQPATRCKGPVCTDHGDHATAL